jgi:hypothetical protein
VANSGQLPGIRINVVLVLLVASDLMVPAGMTGWADDAGVVAAVGQDEGDVGVREPLDLVNGTPGSDVVPDRADRKDRDSNVA